MNQQHSPTNPPVPADEQSPVLASAWNLRYAEKHRLRRLEQFPAGITPPRRVRVYQRRDHYVLQWWDKSQRRTSSERIDGDLLTALGRAREIDERLEHFRSAGVGMPNTSHDELVARYLADLDCRIEAGEIDLATSRRYRSALQHYLDFVGEPDLRRRYRQVNSVDHAFQLEFAAYLNRVRSKANGVGAVGGRPLKRQDFVFDVVRSMFEWGADGQRGNLLATGFQNPFTKRRRGTRQITTDPVRPLDVTMQMAVELVAVTDRFQLGLLAPLLLYGLRPSELSWLFSEHAEQGWLRVINIPELHYTTKGRRDKRFPLVECLSAIWELNRAPSQGLVYKNDLVEKVHKPSEARLSLEALIAEYRRRCASANTGTVAQRLKIRDQLMKQAHQLNYDRIEGEFRKLARQLGWSASATLKDLRHLFSTCLENAGVPEFYRRYFMGHALGKAPIVAYTHITEEKIQEHYRRALESELAPIVAAIKERAATLGPPVKRSIDVDDSPQPVGNPRPELRHCG